MSRFPTLVLQSRRGLRLGIFVVAIAAIGDAPTLARPQQAVAGSVVPADPPVGLVARVRALAVDPNNALIVYAGTSNGVFKTVDGGATWTRVDSGLTYSNVTSLVIDPGSPCSIYAGIDSRLSIPDSTHGIVAVSADCGTSWHVPAGGPAGRLVRSLTFTSDTPPRLYAAYTVNALVTRFPQDFNGVERLTAGVWEFSPLSNTAPPLFALAGDPDDPCTVYAGGPGRVSRSINCEFGTWTPGGGLLSGSGFAVAVHPTLSDNLLAGTSTGQIYRKASAGTEWELVAAVSGAVNAIVYQPANGMVAYAATDGGIVYRSTDSGTNWTPWSIIGPQVSSLATSPSDPLAIYAGGDTFVIDLGSGAGVPPVLTSEATIVYQSGATLRGTVNPNGISTTALFDYGLSASYGSQALATPQPGSGTSPVAVSAAISGLRCETLYHFRAVRVGAPTATGSDMTFVTATCPAGTLTHVSPDSAYQGQTLAVGITGDSTHFTPGVTTASFGAAGITVNDLSVADATHATASITIAATASAGVRSVVMRTGNQFATGPAFTVVGTPALSQVTPGGARRGQANLTVALFAQHTHFEPGVTIADFGAGVTVLSTTVFSSTQAAAVVSLFSDAARGPRTVTVRTNAEVVVMRDGFFVVAGVPAGDFEGDNRADFTVYRPSTGVWHTLRSSSATPTAFAWGIGTDQPVVGDFDGDGKADVAVYRPSNGTWYVVPSASGVPYSTAWGNGADLPVPGDYDGDGQTDIAVYRPSNGTWYVLPSMTEMPYTSAWGDSADIPVPGDYDGDGRTDLAVYRPSDGRWYVIPSTTGVPYSVAWGSSAAQPDRPVAADYDGDGRTDLAVYRPGIGTWYVMPSTTQVPYALVWGIDTDINVPADYDGDGKADVAVFRPSAGIWYVVPSTTGVPYGLAWGIAADIPVLKRP